MWLAWRLNAVSYLVTDSILSPTVPGHCTWSLQVVAVVAVIAVVAVAATIMIIIFFSIFMKMHIQRLMPKSCFWGPSQRVGPTSMKPCRTREVSYLWG